MHAAYPQPEEYLFAYSTDVASGAVEASANLELSVHCLCAGDRLDLASHCESAYLLLSGSIEVAYNGKLSQATRTAGSDASSFVLHVPAGTNGSITALSSCELSLGRAENNSQFEPRCFVAEAENPSG